MTSPTTPRTILGTDYILEALAAEGLGHLFMVPGGLVDPSLPALARQKKLTPVVAAHEGGAVYMADGYARASGTFGAALGIGGPGCCNMATAIAAAKNDDASTATCRRTVDPWPIPVPTTLRAKGVSPEDHPLSLGPLP